MNKITAVALGILAATQAGAVTIQKTDTSMVDLYGRVYAGHLFGDIDKAQSGLGTESYIRVGVKGSSMVTRDYSIFGQFETQVFLADTEKSITANTDNLRARLAFAGIKTDWGWLSFGRQFGALTQVARYTDVGFGNPYSGAGLGLGADKFGTKRSSNVLKYGYGWDGLNVEAQYQFRNQASASSGEDKSSYGLSLTYDVMDTGLGLGLGYNIAKRPGSNDDAKVFVVGAKYEWMGVYTALTWANGSKFYSSTQDHDGLEFALGYDFGNGWQVKGLYNKLSVDAAGATAKFDPVNYWVFGTQYKFTDNFSWIGEYRLNKSDVSATAGSGEYDNDFHLALKYVF